VAQGEAEEEHGAYALIDRLEGPGLGAPDIKKLKEAGYHTIESVCHVTKKDLCTIKGLSDNKVDKIVEAAFKMNGSSGFTTAAEARACTRARAYVRTSQLLPAPRAIARRSSAHGAGTHCVSLLAPRACVVRPRSRRSLNSGRTCA
jgi:hypothetical protein